jgi:solute carrier family 35 (adenosine 3'-phospho 5'-phosphosulfate transporter), member B2
MLHNSLFAKDTKGATFTNNCKENADRMVALQLWPALAFLSRHPACMWNIIILSLAATVGQLFIFHTIKTFGALLFATVMTTRQFLSILLSCFIYGHLLSLGQSMATLVIFGTLYYKNLTSQKKDSKESKPLPTTQEQEKLPLIGGGNDGKSALERLVAAGGN